MAIDGVSVDDTAAGPAMMEIFPRSNQQLGRRCSLPTRARKNALGFGEDGLGVEQMHVTAIAIAAVAGDERRRWRWSSTR